MQQSHDIWDTLYERAFSVRKPRKIAGMVSGGEVGSAILSKSGNIYTGVCVDSCSTLGICAERAALFSMISAGEDAIDKVVAVMPDGNTGAPCGACRELMMQLSNGKGDIEILMQREPRIIVTLKSLMPEWWG
jgi:cytidine deaminase